MTTHRDAIYRNVYRFSKDVEEAAHDGHRIVAARLRPLEPNEPHNMGCDAYCRECDVSFTAFDEEVEEL